MTLKPCLVCGEPTSSTRCPECEQPRQHAASASARGYDAAWSRLSKRARRLQPFCTDCHTTEDLTLDHLPSAWARKARGKAIRLGIDAEVVCRPCNTGRGAARGERASARRLDAGGGNPPRTFARPLEKPQSRTDTSTLGGGSA